MRPLKRLIYESLVKWQGSRSPCVVSELTLVAAMSFHLLLDEQETEAVLCQLWTINLAPERVVRIPGVPMIRRV